MIRRALFDAGSIVGLFVNAALADRRELAHLRSRLAEERDLAETACGVMLKAVRECDTMAAELRRVSDRLACLEAAARDLCSWARDHGDDCAHRDCEDCEEGECEETAEPCTCSLAAEDRLRGLLHDEAAAGTTGGGA